jgi:hypothetical protein
MFKKTSLAIAVLAAAAATTANATNLYSATLNGAITVHLTTIEGQFTNFPNPYNIPGAAEIAGANGEPGIYGGGSVQISGQPGPGGANQMRIVLSSDGSPHSIENVQTGPWLSGLSSAAITSFAPGNTTMVRHVDLPDAASNVNGRACTLDTSVSGQVSYDCWQGMANTTADTNDGAALTIPFDFTNHEPNAYGFMCWGADLLSNVAQQNGCGTIGNIADPNTGNVAVACPMIDMVPATHDDDGDSSTPEVAMQPFPLGFLVPGSTQMLDLYECDNEEYQARMYSKITATAGSEAFTLNYTYTGTIGEPDFEITGADYMSHNSSADGTPRLSQVFSRYGASYTGLGSHATHDASVTQNSAFSGESGKNVPAMGAFGLVALFGGLIAVAARLRRRVS